MRKHVERELKSSAAWKVVVHGKWICPYCVTLALKVGESGPTVDVILDHLDECPEFKGGEGVERPLPELRKLQATREIRRVVKNQLVNNPSWQLIDFSQRWFCAYCGDPTNVTVPKDRKMTEETLQGIIGHVQSCYAYDRGQGKEKPFAHLKAIVRYQNQSRKLAENVRRKLEGDPAWRRKDPKGCWICPYCMAAQEHIDLSSNLLMFENAPGLIAKHLAAACEQFRDGAKPAPLQPARSSSGSTSNLGPGPAGPPPERAESGVLRDADLFDDDESKLELGTDRWGQVKDPRTSPSGRYKSTLWGKEGVPAQIRGEREHGTTLRQLEESGEFTLISDPELRALRQGGSGSDVGARPEARNKARTERVESWRREIEQQLASVRSGALGRSGEISFNESRSDEEDPDLEVALRLELPRRGLELRRVEFRAKPPGGDFIDVIDFGSNRMALVAGGVAGEESEAPLISAMARNLIRRHAAPNLCPSKVLKRVNAEIYSDLDGRSLVQVSYTLFDLDSYRARLARAGLSSPVLMNTARQPVPLPLDSEGMVMGIDQGPIFDSSLEVRSLELKPGDLFVLFTKGVIEARGGTREEFGVYRMHQLVQRYGTHELAYFADKFREYFDLHVQQHRKQADGCVLALRRLPVGEPQAV